MAVSPSGPAVLLPDCETASAMLEREFRFQTGNASAIWLPIEQRMESADKAVDAGNQIMEIEA